LYTVRSSENTCNSSGGAQEEKGKTEWNSVYHQYWWFFELHPPFNANELFRRFFFYLTLCVWSNSGFWCCIFLTLRITRLPSSKQQITNQRNKRDLKSELWRKQARTPPPPNNQSNRSSVQCPLLWKYQFCNGIWPSLPFVCQGSIPGIWWFQTHCTRPIFQESDYPLEAASTWLIIILLCRNSYWRNNFIYLFLYLFI
jgi:hypothetical protein